MGEIKKYYIQKFFNVITDETSYEVLTSTGKNSEVELLLFDITPISPNEQIITFGADCVGKAISRQLLLEIFDDIMTIIRSSDEG